MKTKMAGKAVNLRWLSPLLAASLVTFTTGAALAQSPAEGQKVFGTICTACHSIGEGTKVGPDLKGVTTRRDPAWLARFIKDPAAVRASGDPIAKSNLDTYKTMMPNLGLKDADVAAVVAFLGQGQPGQAAGTPPQYLPSLGIGAAIVIGLTAVGLMAGKKNVEVQS